TVAVAHRPAPVPLEVQAHAGPDASQLAFVADDPVDAVEHAVGVEDDGGVVPGRVGGGAARGTVGVVRQLAAFAAAEVGDAGGDRHAPPLEESCVVHHDQQPLGDDLAVGAAELGHVG